MIWAAQYGCGLTPLEATHNLWNDVESLWEQRRDGNLSKHYEKAKDDGNSSGRCRRYTCWQRLMKAAGSHLKLLLFLRPWTYITQLFVPPWGRQSPTKNSLAHKPKEIRLPKTNRTNLLEPTLDEVTDTLFSSDRLRSPSSPGSALIKKTYVDWLQPDVIRSVSQKMKLCLYND